MLGETEKRFSLTRAALSTLAGEKSKFLLSVTPYLTAAGLYSTPAGRFSTNR